MVGLHQDCFDACGFSFFETFLSSVVETAESVQTASDWAGSDWAQALSFISSLVDFESPYEINMEGGRIPAVGTKREVFKGQAKHTPGGLTKKDLLVNKFGKIVSKRKSQLAKRSNTIARIREYTIPKGSHRIGSRRR